MSPSIMRPVAAVAILPLCFAACSQRVYSPPAQTYSVMPINALGAGQQAMDLEASTHSQIFDPALNAFDGRYRTGVGDNTEVSIEGTAHAVEDTGPSQANRTFYSGRAGVRTNPGHSGATLFAGGGGGYAHSGGAFVAVDSGIAIGYENCYVTPILQASGFISQPTSPKMVDVSDESGHVEYDTPSTTVGGVVRGGLRISLSPERCHAGEQVPWITLGAGTTTLADHDSSATLLGAGLGISIPL